MKRGALIKRVEIFIDDYLYEFYKKIAENVGVKTEQVMADSLLKFAGGLSETITKTKKPTEQS